MHLATISVIAIVASFACSPVVEPQTSPTERRVEKEKEGTAPALEALEVLRDHYSRISDRQRVVIRDAATWADFWSLAKSNQVPIPPAPQIDFTSSVVIAASMGTRSSGGYTIVIESVTDTEDGVRVSVVEHSPGAGCIVTGALTAPVIAVRVPRPGARVTFVERRETQDC